MLGAQKILRICWNPAVGDVSFWHSLLVGGARGVPGVLRSLAYLGERLLV